MSSDERPIIRNRRRRALDTSEQVIVPEPTTPDVFDPGPMVHYPPLPVGQDGLPISPAIRQRVRDLRAIDRRAAKDFILRTLHSFLVAHKPIDEIARAFGVHTSRIYEWRQELWRRIGNELRTKTPTELVAKQIAELESVKATAWQDLRGSRDRGERNKSLNTIINTEKAIADLYARVGLISSTTMTPAVDTSSEDDDGKAGTLQKLAKEFLEGAALAKAKKPDSPKTIEQDISGPIDESDYLL